MVPAQIPDVPIADARNNPWRLIRGSVIRDYEFNIPNCLLEQPVQSAVEDRCPLIGGYEDRNLGHRRNLCDKARVMGP